jgi:hypothetical protein
MAVVPVKLCGLTQRRGFDFKAGIFGEARPILRGAHGQVIEKIYGRR